MLSFKFVADLVEIAERLEKPISEIVWQWETEQSEAMSETVWEEMKARLDVMKAAAYAGIKEREKSYSGLVGDDACRLWNSHLLVGETAGRAAAYAMGISEVNARMGRIVACPTAGSCGILPGTILAAGEFWQCEEAVLIRALFTAAGIGKVIAENASVAGAVGGCQAECGSAAAMAAAAVVEMAGGSPRQSAAAAALALKNLLGLVCDPVGGLVEVPCVKRNAFAAVHALVAAQMALAGVESVIPADEVIEAMDAIGKMLPPELRETSDGGLAKTPTGLKIANSLRKN